ncbi:MAG TPA: DUF4157 domain-containing protein [Kofleriaceae bacterium]|nr:DUF4157 domain-containing protein [Kofleriaceae bacterium]
MGFDREKRLEGGPRERGVGGELVNDLRDEHRPQPGKRTLSEQPLLTWFMEAAGPRCAVGRRTLVDQDSQPPASTRSASIMDRAMSLWSGPRSALDDFRSRGLHEVLAALSSMRCGHGLMEATLSAARRATRPGPPSLTLRPALPDPVGQAMWRAAERRAATLYRHAVDRGDVTTEDPTIELALARAGGGQPLPAAVRRQMELELDVSLDRVRIHTDSVADEAARTVRASAFTVGEDIFFADDAYAPETPAGQKLLVHELAHVVQSYQGRTETGGAGIKVSSPDESLEREADAIADRIGGQRAAPKIGSKPAPARSTSTAHARVMRKAAAPARTFDEPSTPVGKLGRVQAPKGVRLRAWPTPDAESPSAPIPFNGLVYVERRTTQSRANERWCYVIATEAGAAGFCEERYLAIDPPEPTAKLRPTKQNERLAVIAEEAYGKAKDEDNSRLYVQALYIANRDRAGVKLEHVDLSLKDRALRGEDEEETLKVYKGVRVIKGTSLWIPSKAFIDRLKAEGAVTGGSTYIMNAWHKAKDFADKVIDGVKYVAGFIVGVLEGAYNAIVDLFKGAVDMVEAVMEVIWNLVTGNPGRIKEMLMGWVNKMKTAWEHRGEIADEFLKRWNAESMWDRGLFQGEVLGWIMMTVLLILVTMGEDAPAALSGITVRWPQLVKLLKTVDTLGDVTTYLGAAAKAVKVPGRAAAYVTGKLGKAERTAARAAEHASKDAGHIATTAERGGTHAHGKETSPKTASQPVGDHATVTVRGFAQTPKTYPWAKNMEGTVRTVDDVRRIALEHGVRIPQDIEIFAVRAKWLPPDTYAQYMSRDFLPGHRVNWEDFYNKYDNIAVKVSKDILDSDEAIVAVMAHEMHELDGLRKIFAERETIPVEELGRMINPGHRGNLHDQAWDVADRLVANMRAKGNR